MSNYRRVFIWFLLGLTMVQMVKDTFAKSTPVLGEDVVTDNGTVIHFQTPSAP